VPLRLRSALLLARALAPISALLLLVAISLPWAALHVAYGDKVFDSRFSGMDGLLQLGYLAQGSRLLSAALFLLWDFAPVSGLLLGLMLLRRQRISRLLLGLYGVWILLTSALSLLSFHSALVAPGYESCDANCTGTSRGIEWGGWVALAALALGWLALALLIWGRSLVLNPSPAATERYTTQQRVGAGILTRGAALWRWGCMPCPGQRLAVPGCTSR
jgi:hypothetical protein